MVSTTITRLTHSDIKKVYTSGFKSKEDLQVGLEYERIPVSCENYQSAGYYGIDGICELLRIFAARENWDYITDNDNIIGLKQGHDTITLEPGCQMEFSIEPQKDIFSIKDKTDKLNDLLAPLLEELDIALINYGVTPVSTYKTINLIPKRRYRIMAKYLWGILSDVMMRETAGFQGTFDFVDEEDAMKKFRIANMLTPFVTAMFANSPIRGGVDTGYKSFRALSWLNTDNDRCGFFSDFGREFTFDDYIQKVMDAPMLFIEREKEQFIIDGKMTFTEFMNNDSLSQSPIIEDYLLQANLCFPEVRLRNFIEIRNHDCNGGLLPYSMLALYKGILYSKSGMDDIEVLLKDLSIEDYNELRYSVPKTALQTDLGNKLVSDYAKEIINISEYGLREINSEEVKYLDAIKEYTFDNICPADVILKNWYGPWNGNIKRFLEFIIK